MLTPESLQYGTGTYYIMAVVNKSTEATQHTPILVSMVTAVTQCYFWDRNNRTWRSDGCQVRWEWGALLDLTCIPFPFLLGHRPDTTAIGRKTNHPGDKEEGDLW